MHHRLFATLASQLFWLFDVCPHPEASPWGQVLDQVRWCKTCYAGTLSVCDCAIAISRELGNAVCNAQTPAQLPWKDTSAWWARELSWAHHLHGLQEWWELGHLCMGTSATPVSAGGLGHQAEITKCLQVSARCQHLHQRKRQEPDTHPGTRYVFGHGSLDQLFLDKANRAFDSHAPSGCFGYTNVVFEKVLGWCQLFSL